MRTARLVSSALLILAFAGPRAVALAPQVSATPDLVNEVKGNVQRLPLKWKARVGLTTFRTTLMYANGKLLVPSNGQAYDSLADPLDGVHVLDAKTGKLERHIRPAKTGDIPANGGQFVHFYRGDSAGE